MSAALKIRNKSLHIRILNLTKAVVDLIKNYGEYQSAARVFTRVSIKGDDSFETRDEIKIDFGLLVFKYEKEILQLPEFVECAEYMNKNATIRRNFGILDKNKAPMEIILSTLRPFLTKYLSILDSLTFDKKALNALYFEFERYFYAKIERYSVTSPLENFKCESDCIDLTEGLRIRRISSMEKSEYLTSMQYSIGGPSAFGQLNVISLKHVVETTYNHAKETPMDMSSCRPRFEDAVNALRLFKSGAVDFNILRITPISWQPHHGTYYSSMGGYTRPIGQEYVLQKSEVSLFKRLWKKYNEFRNKRAGLNSSKYLNIAFRRFNLGIEEVDFEDKMIDYLISLEALLLPERDELKYRLSNRVAVLLGKGENETEEVRTIIAEAYDLRSDIVHGKSPKEIKIGEKAIPQGDFVSKVEEYVRKSIRFSMVLSKDYKNQETLTRKLDESLFNAKLRRKIHQLTRFA
jgi:hypothetical protein